MASRGERLDRLAAVVSGRLVGDGGVRVVDVTHDSHEAGQGSLFVAIRGFRTDGHRFVDEAVGAGSPAVVVDRDVDVAVPRIVVADTRRALGPLAAEVHGRPSERLAVVGVTGTNGKTTVTHMLEAIASGTGHLPGMIGTIQARVGGKVIPSVRTTPEASDLQRMLAEMARRGADVVAMEVSSHALALGRVDATGFAVAAFTNLGRDHLDFHGDVERYFAAKRELFRPDRTRTAVIWTDDPFGARLAAEVSTPTITVGLSADADLVGRIVETSLAGSLVTVTYRGRTVEVRVPLPGRFNVANGLVALGCAVALGWDLAEAAAALADAPPVPGRFELVAVDGAAGVVVDYAHTPDAIAAAISTARRLAAGRVIVVFGAGGDRDREKRPLMGAAAAAADVTVVTSDNPRTEDPEAIIDEVMAGVPGEAEVVREVDRERAIGIALELAGPSDLVLVLGKGHEQGQEVGDRVIPFDDRAVVRRLAQRGVRS